ncbi:MAG TPA: proteinase inhibitor i78 [Caulobacteraceae bacterium]
MKLVQAILVALAVASCAAPPPSAPYIAPPSAPLALVVVPALPPPPDHCGAIALQYLIGRPRVEIPIPLEPSRRRVLCTTCPIDRGENPFRLTILYDTASSLVTSVACQ